MQTTFDSFEAFRESLIYAVDSGAGLNFDRGSLDMETLEWAFDSSDSGNVADMLQPLESVNCAGCYAPRGLIYNHDIAAKFADWWNAIDEALEAYRDATGETFTPKTCGDLVWFAVEWRAHELASLLRSHFSIED